MLLISRSRLEASQRVGNCSEWNSSHGPRFLMESVRLLLCSKIRLVRFFVWADVIAASSRTAEEVRKEWPHWSVRPRDEPWGQHRNRGKLTRRGRHAGSDPASKRTRSLVVSAMRRGSYGGAGAPIRIRAERVKMALASLQALTPCNVPM